LRHAQTFSKERRDFRWIVASNDFSKLECKFPYIPIPHGLILESSVGEKDKNLCLQPMVWHADKLHRSISENGDSVYSTLPPEPEDGYWNGYYIELVFPGDTHSKVSLFKNAYFFSTPGYTWPNTLPYDDCYGETCVGRTV